MGHSARDCLYNGESNEALAMMQGGYCEQTRSRS